MVNLPPNTLEKMYRFELYKKVFYMELNLNFLMLGGEITPSLLEDREKESKSLPINIFKEI